MTQRLLFLGCNFDQLPYLIEAKKGNYYIVGTDINLHAPAIKHLDKFYQVGYEDIPSLIKIGEEEEFSASDKVFTAASQFAYIGASAFAEYSGIPFISPKTVDICLDKVKFYGVLERLDISIPKFFIYEDKDSVSKKIEAGFNKNFYIKSDYSKSPNYVYRVKDGIIPELHTEHDRYYRRCYIIQEEVKGNHFRVNFFGNRFFFIYKITDRYSVPVRIVEPLGVNIEKKLLKVIRKLDLLNYFIKFDVVFDKENYYVLDIGLDPPARFNYLCAYLGYNFPRMYLEHYLNNKLTYPENERLTSKVLIEGNKVVKLE